MIGLQSTGEANTNQARDEEGDSMDDFVSAPKAILQLFLTRHFPTDDCELMSHELDLLQHQVIVSSFLNPKDFAFVKFVSSIDTSPLTSVS